MNRKQRYIWSAGLICTAAVLGIYYLTIGFQGMPPAEGWYTWYAQLINDGAVVYRDFQYLFPPVYIQLIAAFCKYFGYSIFSLRVLGFFIFAAIGVVSYLIFSKLAKPAVATIAAISTTMFLQSEVVQIFYDYIRVMDLFAYLSVYFLICIMEKMISEYNIITWKKHLNAVAMGVFVSLACMVKQSTGVLLIVYYIILLLFLLLVLNSSRKKYILHSLLGYIVAVGIMFLLMALWLVKNHAWEAFLINTTGNALDAKGGLFTVLFEWIAIGYSAILRQVIPAIIVLMFLSVVSGYIPLCKKNIKMHVVQDAVSTTNWKDWVMVLLGTGIAGVLIVLCRTNLDIAFSVFDRYPVNITWFGFVLCTISFAFLGFYYLYFAISNRKITKDQWNDEKFIQTIPWFALLGAVFAIAYAVGMSGSLCESQTALSVGFLIVLLAKSFESNRFRSVALVLIILCGAFFSSTCAARKYINIYSWWGLTEGTVWEAWDKADAPLLERIKMNSQEAAMYEGVARIIEEYTEEGNEIFCFPHIPVLYSITGRTSGTYTQVQWFDMCNINDINRDIRTLRQDPPKAIVYCSLPETTYIGHEWRFNAGEKSQTRIMSEFLMQMVEEQQYECMGSFPVCEGYTIHVYVDPADTVLTNKN